MKVIGALLLATVLCVGCGDDQAGTIAVENLSNASYLLKYHDGSYVQYFEAAANTKAYVVSKVGGATGKVDVLTESCVTLERDLNLDEFGISMIQIESDGTTNVIAVDKLVADLPGAVHLPNDRC